MSSPQIRQERKERQEYLCSYFHSSTFVLFAFFVSFVVQCFISNLVYQ